MSGFLENALPQLGVGVAAVGLMAYVVLKLSESHQKERQSTEEAFRAYVESNNHKVTELVLQSTEAIKESVNAIKEASENIKQSNLLMKDVRDEFFRSIKRYKR